MPQVHEFSGTFVTTQPSYFIPICSYPVPKQLEPFLSLPIRLSSYTMQTGKEMFSMIMRDIIIECTLTGLAVPSRQGDGNGASPPPHHSAGAKLGLHHGRPQGEDQLATIRAAS